ncbi:MAG: glutathione ABC transporter permease GsiC [Deltaproteobacteria bacterium CG2_30_63_29]|nr:MAG: glutathione ABC transporter permease GsiC [Deltaproteobacteria bacterium CG2_30_63_29]PJB38232.1 MAG: glutathione ABC transporter permease GsiC [Deltaproteobacteria bacterium CG_4_9_14_3_um_filter_63_12]
MASFLIRRAFTSVLVLFGVATLVFAVLRLVPGDPVESLLGEQASQEDYQRLRSCFGLDQPISGQYLRFWSDIADGSMGELCNQPGETVASALSTALPPTVELALAAMLVALLIALPLGVLSALKPNSWFDHLAMFFSLLGVSIPSFWLGPMLLILFALSLKWLPDPGNQTMGVLGLLLPALTLGTALAAKLTRMTRQSVLEVIRQDYVRTAVAKGLHPARVILKHVLRNALMPVTTVATLQLGAVLTGAIIVEKVFARPGLGTLLLEAIEMRNYPLVQGCVLFIATVYISVNFLADLLYGVIDPRIRHS